MTAGSQRVAVTGGCGAIGRRLVARLLQQRSTEVRVIDPRPPVTSTGDPRVSHRNVSVLDGQALAEVFAGCDAVVHLAACASPAVCAAEPVQCFETNVTGTVTVLEACRRRQVPHFVLASTAHVYGRPDDLPVSEDAAARPSSPYACSKLAAEIAVRAWSPLGVRSTIVRLANVYGPSMSTETVLGAARRDAVVKGVVELRSFAPVRDFVHLEDVAEALARLIAAGPPAGDVEVLNVGTGTGHSVADALAILNDVMRELQRPAARLIEKQPEAPEAVPRLVLSTDALARRLSWRPSIDLREGLRRTMREESMIEGPRS